MFRKFNKKEKSMPFAKKSHNRYGIKQSEEENFGVNPWDEYEKCFFIGESKPFSPQQ